MKFGEKLHKEIYGPWRLSYIQYDVLKRELRCRQKSHGWTDNDESDFVQLLENELTKVYDFITAKMIEVESRISYCERTLQTFMNHPENISDENWVVMDEALTEVLFDVNDLGRFSRVNYIGFQKIIKKHDKWTGRDLQQGFVPQMRAQPLDKQRFDVAIVFISSLHDMCRQRGKTRAGNSAAGGDQNAFERATAKYWIHPDNITEVKSIIMLHLPVLVFDKSKRYEALDSAVSSVYFDNPDFDLYTGRLQRDEAAEAIRFRWYGSMSSKNIFIERKTHHAPWLNGTSIKDRFRLGSNEVMPFIKGDFTADAYRDQLQNAKVDEKQIEANHFIADGVQQSFETKELEPMVRIFYNRTAFQIPGDQRVRVSLDTDLTFIREDNLDSKVRRDPETWRRADVGVNPPFANVDEQDIVHFPYAILETKLQTHLGQKPPEWLRKLIKSHLVHEVPRFSKYLHAASTLYSDRIPLIPWWVSEMDIDIRRVRGANFGLTRSRSFRPLIDGKYSHAAEQEMERNQVVNQLARSGNLGRSSSLGAFSTIDRSSSLTRSGTLRQAYSLGRSSSLARASSLRGGDLRPPFLLQDNKSSSALTAIDSERSGSQWNRSSNGSSTAVAVSVSPSISKKDYIVRDSAAGRDMSGRLDSVDEKTANTHSHTDMSLAQRVWHWCAGHNVPVQAENQGDSSNKKGLPKIRVEPKVFFANERTFISWLQFCALLLTVALSLLNFGDTVSRIAGGLFIGISMLVALYALYRFEKRAWMIHHKILGRYDDIWGPAVLCILLVGALCVNFYLRFHN